MRRLDSWTGGIGDDVPTQRAMLPVARRWLPSALATCNLQRPFVIQGFKNIKRGKIFAHDAGGRTTLENSLKNAYENWAGAQVWRICSKTRVGAHNIGELR